MVFCSHQPTRVPLLISQHQISYWTQRMMTLNWKTDAMLSGNTSHIFSFFRQMVKFVEEMIWGYESLLQVGSCCASWWWLCNSVKCILLARAPNKIEISFHRSYNSLFQPDNNTNSIMCEWHELIPRILLIPYSPNLNSIEHVYDADFTKFPAARPIKNLISG